MFLDEATADLMDIDDWKVNLFSLQLRVRENKQTKIKWLHFKKTYTLEITYGLRSKKKFT